MKLSRKTLTNKLDKICSQIVRARGKCQRCGKTSNLQAAHIVSRTYRVVRWHLGNILCLCAGCHFWNHKNPIEFTEWVKELLGEDNYQELRKLAKSGEKLSLSDMQVLYGRYIEELK